MRPNAARCHLGLGELHARAGRRGPSAEHLAAALTMSREMEMPYWIEQTERALEALPP